ncbi:MAG: hypothetical protein J7K40_10235 [candidate division Zixibacteria bacterium]|nr:hypothetical protein [candidate division Zixibacteria bacterium]
MNKQRKLLQQSQLMAIIIISLISAVIIVGFSIKKKPRVATMDAAADEVLTADTLVEELLTQPVEKLCPEIEAVYHQPGRLDILTGERLYTVLKDSIGWGKPKPIEYDDRIMQLNQVLHEHNRILIGGDKLLIVGDDYCEIYSEHDIGAPVNVILKFGEGYLIGANNGIHYFNEEGVDTLLKAEALTTALAEDVGGLWMGTFGDGLWRYDGERWQRRYLHRDNTLFDFVNALSYNYPYLWVGTPSGIFRFNGGSWNQLFVSDSSEVYEVNCFLPMFLRTYIGTEQGLFVFANDSLNAVPEFESEQVIGLFKEGKDILIATRDNGIFKLKGKEAILRPEQLTVTHWELADIK